MKKLFHKHETVVALISILFSLIIGLVNPAFFTLENLLICSKAAWSWEFLRLAC